MPLQTRSIPIRSKMDEGDTHLQAGLAGPGPSEGYSRGPQAVDQAEKPGGPGAGTQTAGVLRAGDTQAASWGLPCSHAGEAAQTPEMRGHRGDSDTQSTRLGTNLGRGSAGKTIHIINISSRVQKVENRRQRVHQCVRMCK